MLEVGSVIHPRKRCLNCAAPTLREALRPEAAHAKSKEVI